LGRNARGIEYDVIAENVIEPVGRHDHDKAGTDANKHVSPNPAAHSSRSRSKPIKLPRVAATNRRTAISKSGSISETPSQTSFNRRGIKGFAIGMVF
jgi:hypothetical protein